MAFEIDDHEDGVFALLTNLCSNVAAKYCYQNRISQKRLANKMRTHSYEIILKKTGQEFPSCDRDPAGDLLCYYLFLQQNAKNVAEYRRSVELKRVISTIKRTNFGSNKDNVNSVLKLLIGLSNSVKEDLSPKMYQNPFTFGLLDEMLPRPPREIFGSPQPYPYFPSHIFELPFSLKRQPRMLDGQSSQTYTEYTVETLDSKSMVADSALQKHGSFDLKTISPMSLASMTSSHMSPYSDSQMFNYPRLTAPRDLQIPCIISEPEVKVSFVSSNTKSDMKEVFRANDDDGSVDIWELVTQVEKDVPVDIWDIVSKLPPTNERQLIASSPRELALWQRIYASEISQLSIVSENQLIRHLKYLIIGVETNSFPFDAELSSFVMKDDLALEGVSRGQLKGYLSDLLQVGSYYRLLHNFAFSSTLDDQFHAHGLVYEAAREVARTYLLEYRLLATEVYEECSKNSKDSSCMPTLLQIRYHMEPLKYEIETVASVYKVIEPEPSCSLPYGAELMSYLFNEISLVTHKKTASTLFTALFSICKVYFKFIEKFIFEGELDDRFHEFFIRKDSQYVNSRSKRYWDKGFHLTQTLAVPEFLRPSAKFILLCGKSLRLLKMCNPSDPLVLLISSDHPSIKCCATFEDLERQQQVLDVYRTRCLFVSGEPVTFDQIQLKREAEKKAFTEMASLKQAETLEKIVAERKRLAQLIIAEKQHSLRVLEAAMAEAKAAKLSAKVRERRRYQLEIEAERATEEVDARLRDDERNKIMEYYSKLNMEVEKSKIHTEWKIKRLQLDQSRIQLLSTEERNLKREKLELEHQRNEEMSMSIQSADFSSETEPNCVGDRGDSDDKMSVSTSSIKREECLQDSPEEVKSHSSGDVFSVICNAAKSIFGVGKTADGINCDNKKELDTQGNIVLNESEINSNQNKMLKSSDEIGKKLDGKYDNIQYLKMRQEALMNRQKVMAHEFGQIDNENNQTKGEPLINVAAVDEENNMDGEWTPFAEAKRNKLKVLGAEFHLKPELKQVTEPVTDAQKEAVVNKQKVLGIEFNLKPEVKQVAKPVTDAQKEAVVNKQKVLGVEFNLKPEVKQVAEPATEAQKEALVNKQKVLGVEFNVPQGFTKREPVTEAQEAAVKNRMKVLGSDYEKSIEENSKRDFNKRSGLTLNLKPYGESTGTITTTPGGLTPGEAFPQLDLETPTTADVPLESALTSDVFTPRSDYNKDIDGNKTVDKEFITSDGFSFPIVDDVGESEIISEILTDESPDNSPSKSLESELKTCRGQYSFFNLIDGSYNLDEFDPFGIKDLKRYSSNHFSSKMNMETSSCYTHPAVIMEEVKKPPYSNIFATQLDSEQHTDEKINSDNIATLTACLQRSVVLPLTYQLEVVNNSILTYFLVNLDMYDHLRSLKDYFFLMDGEFSRSICHNLFTKLEKTINPHELLNFATLHNILDKALGSSISHPHKFSERLSFTVSEAEAPLCVARSSPDALRCVSLTYAVRWPLSIILSHEALARYGKVFQFLLKMRRVFWLLGEDFEALKLSVKLSKQHSRKLLKSPQYISVQIYRHIMASMIRALDNYIVTTCILTSWTEFENDLKKARTLDDLYECHVVYIKKVLFRCLLNNRSTPVMKLLNDMFTVILKFSRVLKAGEWYQQDLNGPFRHSSFVQLEELFHLFEKLAKYLHKVITKLMECGYQRHLVELLAMINLNGYYDPERSKDDTNVSLQSNTRKN